MKIEEAQNSSMGCIGFTGKSHVEEVQALLLLVRYTPVEGGFHAQIGRLKMELEYPEHMKKKPGVAWKKLS